MLKKVFCITQYKHLNDNEFINIVYSHLLDRIPDFQGGLYHLSRLAQGETRASIAASICFSPEGKIFGNQICQNEACDEHLLVIPLERANYRPIAIPMPAS